MKLSDAPEGLKPFLFHGVEFQPWGTNKNAVGYCPFCGTDKLSVHVDSSQFQCFGCAESGNSIAFIRRLWETSYDATINYSPIIEHRGILIKGTPVEWGLARSSIGDEWIVPAYNYEGQLCQLYRYIRIKDKFRLFATPGLRHGLFGRQVYDPTCTHVYLCEGPWDAMVLWELLRTVKATEEGYRITSNHDLTIGGHSSVLAVPGCNVFNPDWCPLFANRDTTILFDNDHPRTHPKTGDLLEPVAWQGVQRIREVLSETRIRPATLRYLRWGEGGYDPSLPHGTDVRDILGGSLQQRVAALRTIQDRIAPLDLRAGGAKQGPDTEIDLLPCESYRKLVNSWRIALKWVDGLDHALAAMLACVASVETVGDQLWLKILSPPSTGKTLLAEAISTNRHYVLPVSSFRGFHSGYRPDGRDDGETNSDLLSSLYNMTMVMKDGDTLLQSPNLSQILAEGRDLYDGAARSHYRNRMGKSHENLRMTWILCGTAALRQIDSSELGERFLDVVIMDKVAPEYEDPILVRAAFRASEAVATSSGGEGQTKYDEDMIRAMQMTGGYVAYLKENAKEGLAAIVAPNEFLMECITLGKFIAYMRARPSSRQIETAEREMAARLVSQLVKLGMCLAYVTNKTTVDEKVMKRVRQVAFDTSRGRVLNLVLETIRYEKGIIPETAKLLLNEPLEQTKKLMRFMRQIGILETFNQKKENGELTKVRWRVTERVRHLVETVLERTEIIRR